jgi:transposase
MKEIAEAESLQYITVYKVIQRYKERGTTTNMPRSGRPPKATLQARRLLKRTIQKEPKLTFEALRKEANLDLSTTTIKKVLHDEGLQHWRARGRPELTQRHATLRLQWALQHRNTDWSKWIFSDECSVETGKGQRKQWVWGLKGQQYKRQHVQPYKKGKQGTCMV